jgi:hypothetical protein
MNEFNDLDDDVNLEYQPLDLEVVRKNVPTFSSEKLAEMIVCDRYFGCYREVSVICMEELARRRAGGDSFDFENYIESSFKKLPELNMSGLNLRDVLTQSIGRKINK